MNKMALRRWLVLIGVVAFALACFFAGYIKYNPSWGRYNVLVITGDTLRSDHLGCYGYKNIRTPVIDELARNGVRFADVISSVPLTLPSHANIFTSTYPPFNQVRDNGNNKLDDSALTLAEIFKNRGYETAAFVSTYVLNGRFGLNQGFEVYDDVREDQNPKVVIRHMDGERTADKTTTAAIGWLRRRSPKPFFMWVHYYDPHSTYNPPLPFREKYKDNPYDGEIAFMDSQIGRLLNEFKRQGILEKTLIVFASDHGEGLGEHKESGHAVFVYDTTLKVPLIFIAPKLFPKNKVIRGQARLADVAPTILDLLNVRKPKTFQGKSLASYIKGKKEFDGLDAYSESLYANNHYKWSPLLAYRTREWKYIRSSKPELYHITEDPNELVNLADARPDIADNLDLRLKEFLLEVSSADAKDTSVEMDEATREKLMSLGYIQGTEEAASDEPVPIEMVEIMEKINLHVRQANEGMMTEAIQGFKEVLERDPNNAEVYIHLGNVHRELGKYDEAIGYFKKALSFTPDETKIHDGLGNVYKSMGMVDKAFEEFKKADELDPENPSHLNNLGWVHQQKLEIDRAIAYYDRALALDNEMATTIANRAICYRIQGKVRLALAELKKAIQLDPDLAFAYAELGSCFAILGDLDTAMKACLKAIEIDPRSVDGYNNLGVILQRKGQPSKALESFMKALQYQPWNPVIYVNVGNSYLMLQDPQKAKEFYEKALEISPNNPQATQRLQQILSYETRSSLGGR